MYIHLPGRHYDVNPFQPQAFVSGLSLPSLSIFWAVSRRSAAAISTSHGCLYRLELHLDRLFLVYRQGFFLSARLFRKMWVLSAIDSIIQNEESKIAYDYVMMLRKNKFEHMVYYFKKIDYLNCNAGKKVKTTTNRKETLIRNYCTKI